MTFQKTSLLLLATAALQILQAAPDVVKASSFGFDKTNATQCLKAAFKSGAKKVVIDNVGATWYTEPQFLAANQEVVVADGVTISALPGAFKGIGDCLFSISEVSNVVFRGEGSAKLTMPRADYQDTTRYEWGGGWRHAVCLKGAQNVVVKDLHIEGSGGDGVYIRKTGKFESRDIRLENLTCVGHHRQGFSIICVENLLVKNCKFLQTGGQAPMCGLDIEPNYSSDYLVNIRFEGCVFQENASSGIDLHLAAPNAKTRPISISFKDCVSTHNKMAGIVITSSSSTPAKGTVLFENCRIADNVSGAMQIAAQQPNGLDITFKNCSFDNGEATAPAIMLHPGKAHANFTGVHFIGCTMNPRKGKPIVFYGTNGFGLTGIDGDVTLPDGKKIDFPKMIADNQPNKNIQSFETEEVALTKLRPFPSNVKVAKPDMVCSRGNFTFVQYFPAAGDYPVTFIPVQIGRNVPKSQIILRDPQGNSSEVFEVNAEPYTYVYHAKGQGIIQYQVNTTNGMKVKCSSPSGYLANQRVPLIWGGHHDFYFVAPAGLQEVKVEISTPFTEPTDAALVDGSGKTVAKATDIRNVHILSAKRPADAKDEIWILRMTNVFEDHAFRVGAGAIPIVTTDPQLLLYKK